jgi:hypothetical protein
MSLRWISASVSLALALSLGCGGGTATGSDEPTTAKEKQRREAAASDPPTPAGKSAHWRYTGDRNDCFFVVGGHCFKTEQAACTAARCGKRTCETTGGGPVTVSCAK